MAYIGKDPAEAYQSFVKQDFSVSATTSYTLSQAVNNQNEIALFINHVRQEPTTAYTASGTSLTLTSATASGDDMYCVYLGMAKQTINPSDGSVGNSQVASSIINSQTAETSIAGGDEVLIYDTSASALRKMTRTNFVSGVGGTNTPSFFAHRNGSGNQGCSENTMTKVQMDQEVYDVGGCYNATGSTVTLNGISVPSYAFAPNEAGKYFVYASVRANESTSETNQVEINIRVNGSNIVGGATIDNRNNPGADTTTTINHVVVLDGVDDYVEIFCKIENASNVSSNFHQEGTYFGAYKIVE